MLLARAQRGNRRLEGHLVLHGRPGGVSDTRQAAQGALEAKLCSSVLPPSARLGLRDPHLGWSLMVTNAICCLTDVLGDS